MFLLNVPSTVTQKVNKLYRECEQRTVLLSKNIMADFFKFKHSQKNSSYAQ